MILRKILSSAIGQTVTTSPLLLRQENLNASSVALSLTSQPSLNYIISFVVDIDGVSQTLNVQVNLLRKISTNVQANTTTIGSFNTLRKLAVDISGHSITFPVFLLVDWGVGEPEIVFYRSTFKKRVVLWSVLRVGSFEGKSQLLRSIDLRSELDMEEG